MCRRIEEQALGRLRSCLGFKHVLDSPPTSGYTIRRDQRQRSELVEAGSRLLRELLLMPSCVSPVLNEINGPRPGLDLLQSLLIVGIKPW